MTFSLSITDRCVFITTSITNFLIENVFSYLFDTYFLFSNYTSYTDRIVVLKLFAKLCIVRSKSDDTITKIHHQLFSSLLVIL